MSEVPLYRSEGNVCVPSPLPLHPAAPRPFVWELTKETIYLSLGCLQGGACGESAPVAAEGS